MDLILPKKEEAKQPSRETSIEVKDGMLLVQVDLHKNQVNCYGTLEYAKEMASRYFLTRELAERQAATQRVEAEKTKVDEALKKIGVL